MVVQDCYRAHGRPQIYDGVRSLMRKINIEVAEISEIRDGAYSCGHTLVQPAQTCYTHLAQKRFGEDVFAGCFSEHEDEEKTAVMAAHCKTIQTTEVVCSCAACPQGMEENGK